MTNMNRLNTNTPWNLNEHTINKTDINFYVKLIHVNRYGSGGPLSPKKAARTNSVSYKRKEEIEGEKLVKQTKISNLIMPSRIISQIPLWNYRKQANNIHQMKKQPLILLKSNSSYKNKSGRLKKLQKDSPNKKRSQTEHFDQKSSQLTNEKNVDLNDLKANKTFSFQFSFKNRIKTEPDDKDLKKYNITDMIQKGRSKSKRQTIRQVLFFKQDKIQKKRQFIMKRFRTTLNKAKFSNALIVRQTSN